MIIHRVTLALDAKGYYSSSARNQPTISSVRWMELDGGEWESDLDTFGEDAISVRDNGKTWIVSHHISAISFTCNASYPVMWVFELTQHTNNHDDLFSMQIRTIRKSISSTTVADLSNPRLQQYYSTIHTYGDFNRMTGKYSCQNTLDERSQNDLYLYWQGQFASYLVLAGETLNLSPSENNQSLILPCYVSYPEGPVSLFKGNGKEFESMPSNGAKNGIKVNFDPKIGFTLTTERNNASLFGKYKCVEESQDDYILIDVEYEGKPKVHFEDILLANAKYYFDSQKDELVCCSNTVRPPVFRDIFCSNVATCRIHEHQLLKVENDGQRYKSGGCTSTKIYPRETVMFRCKGDAIDITRHFYTDFSQAGSNAFNTYFSWNSIPSENMMKIIPHFNGSVYNKQIVSISCLVLPSYFSEGIRWGLKKKNGSITIITSPDDINDDIDLFTDKIFHNVDMTVSMDISDIICYAPVWNSTDWVHKSVSLEVHESVPPEIEEKEREAMYMTVGDTEQILECKSTGLPLPSFGWEKDGQIISTNSKHILEANGTSVLIISSVSPDTQGRYKCSASNWGGRDTMTIDVVVAEPSLAWSTASIATLSVAVVLLTVATGFVVYKMQLESKIIAHLTRSLFRDVEPNSGT